MPLELPKNSPAPPLAELPDIYALKALVRGEATTDQQLRVVDWLLNVATSYYELSFRRGEGGERESAFEEGRRYVGWSIVKIANMAMTQRREPGGEAAEQGR